MYFLLCTYVHSRYHHRAHLKFEVTLQKCYTKKQFFFFCFYLVWFDVGNDQSNDLTKKEKKHLYIHSPSFSDFQKELKTFSVWEQGAIWHAGQGVQNWKKTENCRQQIVDSDFEVYIFLFWYRRCTYYTWCLDVILFAQNLKHSLQWRNRVT